MLDAAPAATSSSASTRATCTWCSAPAADGKPVRFRVQHRRRRPGADHGADTDAAGNGIVKEQRLYQLIRQSRDVGEHLFSIEFLDPGVQAYSFTFG